MVQDSERVTEPVSLVTFQLIELQPAEQDTGGVESGLGWTETSSLEQDNSKRENSRRWIMFFMTVNFNGYNESNSLHSYMPSTQKCQSFFPEKMQKQQNRPVSIQVRI